MTLRKRIEADGITAESVYGDAPEREDMSTMDPWGVTLRFGDRVLAVPFYTGEGLRERMADGPSAADVLDCLASDASSVLNARGFEDWAGDLGFDPDSRKAERTYREIEAQTELLRGFLGDAFDAYLWDTERL